jgi:hypothetical protein
MNTHAGTCRDRYTHTDYMATPQQQQQYPVLTRGLLRHLHSTYGLCSDLVRGFIAQDARTGLFLRLSGVARKAAAGVALLTAQTTEGKLCTLAVDDVSDAPPEPTAATLQALRVTAHEAEMLHKQHLYAQMRAATFVVGALRVPWGMCTKRTHVASVIPRRVVDGKFEYLLQHRRPEVWLEKRMQAPGSDSLGFVGGRADPPVLDLQTPLYTAYRELCEETGTSMRLLPFEMFCDAVVKWLDVSDDGAEAVPAPRGCKRVLLSQGQTGCANAPALDDTAPLARLFAPSDSRVCHSPHQLFVLDVGTLQARGCLSATWPEVATPEVCTRVWPSGHVWVTELQLQLLASKQSNMQDVRPDARLQRYLALHGQLLVPRRRDNWAVGFHGTSSACAEQIRKEGNVMRPSTVGMMGPGVYIADEAKARKFATRRVQEHAFEGVPVILKLMVDLGHCGPAVYTPCGCSSGCSKPLVDHAQRWHLHRGLDAVYVPAERYTSKSPEWVVADPQRVYIVNVIAVAPEGPGCDGASAARP